MTVQKYYRPELDVLRFIAFLFVFFTHRMDLAPIDSTKYYWGYHFSLIGVYGVPLFFFLSAFLITELLTKELELNGKISIKSFYLRRILRIWSLYFTFFFGIVLLSFFSNKFGNISVNSQLAFSLFSGNWYITFNQWLSSYPLNPLWSISVEEQLYILIPLLTFFGGKRVLKTFSFLAILIAYLTIIWYAQNPTHGFRGDWTNSFVHFQFFAAGILLSVYFKGWQPNWHIISRVVLFIGGLLCWLIASIVCKINADAPHLSNILESVIGWLLILIGVILQFLSFYGTQKRFFPSLFIYLGRISYGLYIFHITIFYLVYYIFKDEFRVFYKLIGLNEWGNNIGFLIALLATIGISMASYRFFERPFLQLKKRFTIIQSRDV